MTDVSIIIVNYNTLKMTSECIDSVIEKTEGISYEIILVDNASSDGSKDFFSNDKRVKYIYNDENLGFGCANNKGIEIAEGRNILFLNPDTLLRNNAIKILSDYLDSHDKVGGCGGNLFLPDGTPGMSFGRRMPSIAEEINYFFEDRLYDIAYGKNRRFNHTQRPLKVGFISGADLMAKRCVLNETGVFNPAFHLYYEETELCVRIHRSGKSLISVPLAEITHFDGGKSRREGSEKIYEQYRVQMEISKRIFFDLVYSKPYRIIAYSIRWSKIYLKLMSPLRSTRERWKREKRIMEEAKRRYLSNKDVVNA